MKGIYQQFADWVGQQDPAREYNYTDNRGCAFALFLCASGMASKPSVAPERWWDRSAQFRDGRIVEHALDERINAAVIKRPHTFGALSERLKA
jgi:hypothetical protein